MIWRRRRAQASGGGRERAVTPAQAADVAEARKALSEVRKATESSRSRWPMVLEIKAKLREIRETNHLAEDLKLIFSEHRS